ncbi:phosphonoacetaldehyde hydrolase [Lacunimicrobium album]
MSLLETTVSSKVKLVIFDWAGTIIDFGSRAPVVVMQNLFVTHGVPVTDQEVREPMETAKRDHIQAILAMPSVRLRWKNRFGAEPTELDLDGLFREFLPMQKTVLREYTQPIPGAIDLLNQLRASGIQIGSTTGYTRELMEIVIPSAKERGLSPDFVVTSDEVPQGRPAPDMIQKVMQLAGIVDPSEVVKVDDTIVGIQSAVNAGCRGIAVMASGNSLGMSFEDYQKLPISEREIKLSEIRRQFEQAGADDVIETVADLMDLLDIVR